MKTLVVIKRELLGFFTEPIAYVLIAVLVALFGFTTFSLGDDNFFTLGEASLNSFFYWHPRIYLFLVPAIGMHIWTTERESGHIELLMTYPASIWNYVLGKFLASWIFMGFCLLLTFPIVFAVMDLGNPDLGVIFCGYLASFLLSSVFMAWVNLTSAIAKSQTSSFILSFVICFLLILSDDPSITDYLKDWVSPSIFELTSSISVIVPFETLSRGVVDFRSIFYFVSMTILPILLTGLILKSYKVGK
jgi:ABC-2 type transport system permease protein